MNNETHIIKMQRLNIQVPTQESAHEIQNKFSSVYQSIVVPALEEVFNNLITDDEVISLDKVEIDIGTIVLDDIEHQFPEKVSHQIKEKLMEQLREARTEYALSNATDDSSSPDNSASAGTRVQKIGHAKLEQVIHFLKSGAVPWWVSNTSKQNIGDALRHVIKAHPVKFTDQLGKILAHRSVRKRLIFQFPESLVQAVVQLFSKEYAQFIDLLYQDLKEVQKHTRFVALNSSTFRMKVWDVGIHYLAVQILKQSTDKTKLISNPKAQQEILAQILESLTPGQTKGNKGAEAKKVLTRLQQGISSKRGKQIAFRTPQFKLLVKAIVEVNLPSDRKEHKEKPGQKDPTDTLLKESKEKGTRLKDQHGKSEEDEAKSEIDETKTSTTKDLLADGKGTDKLAIDSEAVSKTEGQEVEHKAKQKGIADEKSHSTKASSKEQGDKEEDERIELGNLKKHDTPETANTKEQVDNQKEEQKTHKKEHKAELNKTDNQHANKVIEPENNAALQKESNKEEVKGDDEILYDTELSNMESEMTSSLDHLDELIDIKEGYIENAGLVILWPYLKPLFEELKLVDKGSFATEEATYKAVHILQFLLNGEEEENPEYELLLNKLLCGLDITDPVTSGIKITKTEKSECTNLLESVIKNWPALKNTSPEGFRDTFLKRQGILTKEAKGWLVKVDRGSFDMLLDTLPWAISMIKLPWNEDVIYVEW